MKELTLVGLGMALAIGIVGIINSINPKASKQHPYIQWSDAINRPPKGFEKVVDIYYNDTRDTIFMELSYGPE